jgi:hypothetical protein
LPNLPASSRIAPTKNQTPNPPVGESHPRKKTLHGPTHLPMIKRIWNSPTLNTWASFFGRSLGSVLVLPLVLRKFSVEDFNVWALFSTLLGLQLLVDMGFCVTFIRAIAFCLAGAESPAAFQRNAAVSKNDGPNWSLLDRVVGSMRFIYRRLALLYLVFLAVVGSAVLARPISLTPNASSAWLAWAVVVATGYVNLRTNYLAVLLQGLNEIALVRRWETLTSLGSVLTGFVVLLLGGKLLTFVAAVQVWSLIAALRNYWLCQQVAGQRFKPLPGVQKDPEMLATLWPATWRSGVGVLMSFGLIQATGLVNAQFATAANSASYMLCLRIMQLISSFSQAPFYSKLSLLPRLRAEGNIKGLLEVAGNGMRKSLWTYSLGFAAAGLIGPVILARISSNVEFPQPTFWVILGAMIFVERYAAMHLHLYSTTNHIITHIANGVTGLLVITFTLILLPILGLLALPTGLLAGYLSFYSWYPVRHAYREFKMRFLDFEVRNSFGPAIVFVAAAAAILFMGK